MAVYQHTWGLTTYTKSAYQVRVTADGTSSPVVGSSRPALNAEELALPEAPAFLSG